MKVVTLEAIEWIESPNYYDGRTAQPVSIVIHWWGDPSLNPQMSGIIRHFQSSVAEVSAHFVVSGDRVVQMVNMGDTAWHARQANPYTIGIEVDPNTPGNTYETVGALVKFIRSYYGDLPLKKHSDYVATACPGTLNLRLIDDYAYGRVTAPAPAPAPQLLYKVIKDGKQIGAYSIELNAYKAFRANSADAIMLNTGNVTQALIDKYEPKPTTPPPTPDYSEKDKQQDAAIAELQKKQTAQASVLQGIADFLASIFSGFKRG